MGDVGSSAACSRSGGGTSVVRVDKLSSIVCRECLVRESD